MNVHPLTLGFVQAYLIETPDGLFLVDCGMPGREKKIQAAMQRLGRQDLKLIFITHAHADHTGSAAALKRLTGAQVAAAPGDGCLNEPDPPAAGATGCRPGGRGQTGALRAAGQSCPHAWSFARLLLPGFGRP
jgi:glyoxylase-like metal-dependent hydrolase (beta-lactamase superfamily II)